MKRKNESIERLYHEKITKREEEEYINEKYENESSIISPYPDKTKYKLIKRGVFHEINENDIYVKKNSNMISQFKRALKLLDSKNFKKVIIHGKFFKKIIN
jgi:hypothetical protein